MYLLVKDSILVKKFGDKYLRVSFSVPPEDVKVFADEFKKAVEVLRK